MSDSSNSLNNIRSIQRRIKRQIDRVKEVLQKIEDGEISQNQPFIGLGSTGSIEGLQSPHRNLKEALQHDLHILQQILKQSNAERRKMVEQTTRRKITKARGNIRSYLNESAQDGDLDEKERKKALAMAHKVLKSSITMLKNNPSKRNMQTALTSLGDALRLGSNTERGESADAFREIKIAAKTRHSKAEQSFRNAPTASKLGKLLQETELSQLVGVEGSNDKPAGWKSAGNLRCTTEPGDTLSGLSEKYYGKPGFWDVIYLENFGKIGNNPDQLRTGIEIVIP